MHVSTAFRALASFMSQLTVKDDVGKIGSKKQSYSEVPALLSFAVWVICSLIPPIDSKTHSSFRLSYE